MASLRPRKVLLHIISCLAHSCQRSGYELFSALSARTKSDFITKASNLNANAKQVKPIPIYLPAKEMGRTVTGK